MTAGTLYVVATPLGHLGDLSPRAAQMLRTVPVVAAEDTRRSRALLSHLDAHPKLVSYHAHAGAGRADLLLEILQDGRDVALVTDAGTPAVSDPGAALVAAVRAAGVVVVPIPGPSAVATALSAAGLPADRYCFMGFVPRKGSERRRLLARAAAEEWTTVFFEAPGRLHDLLSDLAEVAGPDREAVVARELTKLHEEIRAGTLGGLLLHYGEEGPRGEVTVLLRGTGEPPPALDRTAEGVALAQELLAGGRTRKETVREVVDRLGIPRNDAYRMVMDLA
ncbi:MAG TPA: 16S rRNA (cytidine(1402)-2'-O)-methyltransferase [Gemmatimonadales bacterium]|nr:16S rRNA (cytidine(1402)-2'-O)-methyltransferase [Gemmatimonadales bacterium]